ncbi:unnamed protein product, partial [Onchocerca flexuosa]|uniref:Structural maintenance of chromosomes protein 5 n=1 Tax=Onchocerca flexuosa TaxID=387005 RepID=A0A183HDY9_9BILA
TIVCGLCLAVGGTPKLLGRSELLADYIKYGSDEGSIKVFIRDSKLGKDRVLSTVLHRSGASNFFVDDEKVTQTKLRDVAESYNIQVDNPCTFLAQDKVKSFAEQKPSVLLKNTEKAVGKELIDLHNSIQDIRFNQSPLSRAKYLEDCLNSVQNELKTLVPLIENYRRRETMRERIQLLLRKQLYLEYLDAETIADEKAQYKRVKEKELKEMNKLLSVREETEKLLAVESVDESVNNTGFFY